jgi:hypothetical protein
MIAFLLVCVLLFACLPMASAKKDRDRGVVPRIYLTGFGSAIYYNEGKPEQELVSVANTDGIEETIFLDLLPALAGGAATLNAETAANGVNALLYDLMGHLACDKSGNTIAPISVTPRLDTKQDHQKEPQYDYLYDWRLDMVDAAEGLYAFIKEVAAQTGHKKVALLADSEGCNVVMAYLALYKQEYLDSVVLNIPAIGGLTMVGELFTGNADISIPTLMDYLAQTVGDDSGTLDSFLEIVRVLGILAPLVTGAEALVSELAPYLYDGALMDIFGTMPCLWSFVPPAYFDDAKEFMFAGKTGYDGLIRKINRYHDLVQVNAVSLLRNTSKAGVKVALSVNYGKALIPVTKNCDYESDSLIDTHRASAGATVARRHKTLPGSTVGKYRSADGVIDASTCALPDQTWFVKGLEHEPRPMRDWANWVIDSKEQVTITSDPLYPQFLQADADWNISPLSDSPEEPLSTDVGAAFETFSDNLFPLLTK